MKTLLLCIPFKDKSKVMGTVSVLKIYWNVYFDIVFDILHRFHIIVPTPLRKEKRYCRFGASKAWTNHKLPSIWVNVNLLYLILHYSACFVLHTLIFFQPTNITTFIWWNSEIWSQNRCYYYFCIVYWLLLDFDISGYELTRYFF